MCPRCHRLECVWVRESDHQQKSRQTSRWVGLRARDLCVWDRERSELWWARGYQCAAKFCKDRCCSLNTLWIQQATGQTSPSLFPIGEKTEDSRIMGHTHCLNSIGRYKQVWCSHKQQNAPQMGQHSGVYVWFCVFSDILLHELFPFFVPSLTVQDSFCCGLPNQWCVHLNAKHTVGSFSFSSTATWSVPTRL